MEKRGLGKGLAALIADNSPEEEGAKVFEVAVSKITPNPFQPRTLFDPIKMEELVASITEHGILQPVLLRKVGHDRYQVVAGERRFRAAQVAGLPRIPAVVKECSDQDMLEMAVVENLQREDIGAMESARAYRRLMDEFHLTQELVAQRVGKSRSAVANVVRLLKLPEEIQNSVEREEISEGHARALLEIRSEEDILRAWRSVVKSQMSVRETERMTRGMRGNTESAPTEGNPVLPPAREKTDPNLASITDTLRQALSTKVAIRLTSGGAGKIEIEFFSESERDRLVEMLSQARYSR